MIEFQTKIKDGVIRIPEKYRKEITQRVKVILYPETLSETSFDLIDELLSSPIKVVDFTPLTRDVIY